jgi:two-component system, OmpR family, sensor kinase
MSAPARPAHGPWQSARRLSDRTPMRVKLIAAVLALVAIALAVISVAGLTYLRSYLIGQADTQLAAGAAQPNVQQNLVTYVALGGTQPGLTEGAAIGWIPAGGTVHWVTREPRNGYAMSPSGSSTSLTPYAPSPVVKPGAAWLSGRVTQTVGATSGPGRWRMLAVSSDSLVTPRGNPITLIGPDNQQVSGTLVVALDVSGVYQTLGRLTAIDVIVSSILLAGIAILGVAVIRASLRPLTDIEKTAEAIAAGELSRRVPDHDPRTEIGRLGRSLNAMLAQIEAAFQARSASELAARRSEDKMRQFVADASHELRTPLTAIRGFAEYYRQRGGVDTTGPAEIEAPPGRAQLQAGPGTSSAAGPATSRAAEGPAAAGPAAGSPETADAATADPATADSGTAGPATAGRKIPEPHTPGAAGSGKLSPPELDRIMRRVEQESSRMGVLVEDMLLLARLDQQRPLEHRTVDLLTLAADAVHDARVVAPDRNINLTVGAGAALLVLGDEVRLRQVIGNLMSNAMAHTPDGTPIDVRIRSGSLDEARVTGRPAGPGQPGPGQPAARPRSAAVLEVTDYGPGLTREQAERAFERFYRADQARTSGGSGLGLAIVASLVAAHGGAVWVESIPGAGATFRIALPLAPEAMHDDAEDLGDPVSLARPRPLGTVTDVRPGPVA